MPFVEITIGTGTLSGDQKTKLGKVVHNKIAEFFQDVFKDKAVEMNIWVVIREESSDDFIVNGETITEIQKKSFSK